ncbi:hypothetical protein KPA93_25090 [Burkholderia cenocepacia]|uniref:hypothetical protein n=1 Tax=Burkholderia cepacia complex TaxID=87882 RepID=UPI000F5B6C08|nr:MULTISPECIES: hypothetical protein [Burkholderia cepacia complex]MBR8073338.1 hypothetical protein [Burkholderia cenocepacia]MDR8026501.1 hypothetical protein [Burkholderia cenocepacia]MDR8043755.1 hypothetical protein [Burkholderia cenocepacia]RQS79743.1 hypothetical protein DF032_14320 [Burkholderia seminalis]
MTTYTYSIQRDTLIQAAFRVMGTFNDDAPPPQSDITNAAQALNLMIKQWMTKDYPLWCVTDVPFTVQQGVTSYQLGPTSTNAQLQAFRPLRIPMARLQYANTNPALEVPLVKLSRQEYDLMGNKTAQGTPNSFYYDPQLGNGVLYLFLTPDSNPNVCILTCQRPIADVINSTDNFDFPIEWQNALKYGLASELLTEYFVPERVANRIERRAEQYLNDMLDWDQEDAPMYLQPDMRRM